MDLKKLSEAFALQLEEKGFRNLTIEPLFNTEGTSANLLNYLRSQHVLWMLPGQVNMDGEAIFPVHMRMFSSTAREELEFKIGYQPSKNYTLDWIALSRLDQHGHDTQIGITLNSPQIPTLKEIRVLADQYEQRRTAQKLKSINADFVCKAGTQDTVVFTKIPKAEKAAKESERPLLPGSGERQKRKQKNQKL